MVLLHGQHTKNVEEEMPKPKGFGVDEKDLEHDIPEPLTHHSIICRVCKKIKKTEIKYYLRCQDCRTSHKYRRDVTQDLWATWKHNP